MANTELEWTGERLVTSIRSIGATEHLHRYAMAAEFIENKIVLDIASGEGYGSFLMTNKAKQVIGVDISDEAIVHASNKYKRENLTFKIGSVTDIPLEKSSIDVVISFETIEHISEQERMLAEIKRVLKPEGILIISTPEKENYEDVNENKNSFHVKELYFKEFENLIKNHFSFYSFLFQKQVYGTLIAPKDFSRNFVEYSGSFENIESNKLLKNPIFNICIASQFKTPFLGVSYFDASYCYYETIEELKNSINRILNSKTYKLGKLLIAPIRAIKRIIS